MASSPTSHTHLSCEPAASPPVSPPGGSRYNASRPAASKLPSPRHTRRFATLIFSLFFFCGGYLVNKARGKWGVSAIPLWDFYAKKWRNAPIFEPIFSVSAATQTPA